MSGRYNEEEEIEKEVLELYESLKSTNVNYNHILENLLYRAITAKRDIEKLSRRDANSISTYEAKHHLNSIGEEITSDTGYGFMLFKERKGYLDEEIIDSLIKENSEALKELS